MTSLSTARDFSAATRSAFDRAHAASGVATAQELRLAGRRIRVRYVAPDLAARFAPALAHLEAGPAAPGDVDIDLDVACWDRSLTDVVPPAPPWSLDDYLPESRIRGLVDGPVRATYDAVSRVFCLYDRDQRSAVLHAITSASVPRWMDRAPFRTFLTWWAADRGLALLHASSVARADGAVLFAGASGSGKSTTALTCFAAGMDLVSDDACLVTVDPAPHAYSVYRLAKLEPDARARLPVLSDHAIHHDDEQTVIDPGAQHRADAPLRAILLPVVTGEVASRVAAVNATEAMRTLGPTTLLEGGGLAAGALRTLTTVSRTVPCFRFELGSDPDGVVACVGDVLDRGPVSAA